MAANDLCACAKLYVVFINLDKAFDSFDHDLLCLFESDKNFRVVC